MSIYYRDGTFFSLDVNLLPWWKKFYYEIYTLCANKYIRFLNVLRNLPLSEIHLPISIVLDLISGCAHLHTGENDHHAPYRLWHKQNNSNVTDITKLMAGEICCCNRVLFHSFYYFSAERYSSLCRNSLSYMVSSVTSGFHYVMKWYIPDIPGMLVPGELIPKVNNNKHRPKISNLL